MTSPLRFALWSCAMVIAWFSGHSVCAQSLQVRSPNGHLTLKIELDGTQQATVNLSRDDVVLVHFTLGLQFGDSGLFGQRLKILESATNSQDLTYQIAVGKTESARDRHNELSVLVEEASAAHRRLQFVFRVFDDGAAFCYQIPEQPAMNEFVLTDEHTRFEFPGSPTAYVLPLKNYTTPYESYYQKLQVAEIDSDRLFGMPLLLQRELTSDQSVWIGLTEAALTDYAGAYLSGVAGEPGVLTTKLSPLPGRSEGAKVLGTAPHASPWRVMMVGDDPGRLLESNLIFNLSDPPKIEDTSWIKPEKTTFPWWNHYVLEGVDFEPGVNTATMKHYIDFCAQHNIPYHSLDGLDIAWYGGPIAPNGPTDITTAAPSIDLPQLLDYAKQKGVRLRLWMHWRALQPQIDEAFALYEKWGIEGVMVDFMDRDDQEMVRFYHEMAEKAAKHHLTLTLHGAYKPTGMERTWPNVLNYEAALNQEYNKWGNGNSKGTPPTHNLDIALIRMLAGPLDYHQGGMRNVLPVNYHFRDIAPPVQGTRGHQLGMYVVYQNHLPMMADYPSAYRDQPELDFLVQIPSNWDETHVLQAEMRKSLVIARRDGDDWWIGGMSGDDDVALTLPLAFLGDGDFELTMWIDDPESPPTTVVQKQQTVQSSTQLEFNLPAAGGFAAHLQSVGR
ncbi:glycoside hydrolase family 97 protein [Stieleria sp. TO1_6]|nr:glycoside hydrolase family 97 protein [Stieleria tagensis]